VSRQRQAVSNQQRRASKSRMLSADRQKLASTARPLL